MKMRILFVTIAALFLSACNGANAPTPPSNDVSVSDCFAAGNTCTHAEKMAQKNAEKQLN